MKSPLLLMRLLSAILSFALVTKVTAQTVVFSENFSGFTTGTHSSPSTYDASGTLDTKTNSAGWTGYKVYSAGGEIKLGTSEVPGWIETPEINFSGYEGDLILKFDISRWPDDETSVRILLNGYQIGNTLTPSNEFMTVEIPVTKGTSSGKIRFESLAKRFYLDNVQVIEHNTTGLHDAEVRSSTVVIYPNPSGDYIEIEGISLYSRYEIYNLTGNSVLNGFNEGSDRVIIDLTSLSAGIYIIRLSSSGVIFKTTFIKY